MPVKPHSFTGIVYYNWCQGWHGGRGCSRLMCAPVVVVEDVGGAPRSAIALAISLKWEIFYDWHFAEVVTEFIELDDEGA